MFHEKKVSLIIPAFNEEKTIGVVLEDFRSSPYIDEIIVVDNRCTDSTAAIAKQHGAKVVQEEKPGYGCALRCGMDHAEGEILVLTEADGSFRSTDLIKLLVYLGDAGMVVGTRTTKQMVEQGANMRWLLRWGNAFVAKVLEALWWFSHEPRFTDMGCTYRALWADSYRKMRPNLRERGPSFSPEMMAEALRCNLRVIEIPVNYYRRKGGESKHSESLSKVLKTGFGMLMTVLHKRMERQRPSSISPQSGPPLEKEPPKGQ